MYCGRYLHGKGVDFRAGETVSLSMKRHQRLCEIIAKSGNMEQFPAWDLPSLPCCVFGRGKSAHPCSCCTVNSRNVLLDGCIICLRTAGPFILVKCTLLYQTNIVVYLFFTLQKFCKSYFLCCSMAGFILSDRVYIKRY